MTKVSVQLDHKEVDKLMAYWPGLSQSECIRLAVERFPANEPDNLLQAVARALQENLSYTLVVLDTCRGFQVMTVRRVTVDPNSSQVVLETR